MNDPIQRSRTVADQVLGILRNRIQGYFYAPEDRLPAENELASELHVSRSTVRIAMGILVAEGIIVRRQGDGTYINRHFIEMSTQYGAIKEFTKIIQRDGHKPSIKPLKLFTRPAEEAEAKKLEIPTGSSVAILDRLFLSDDRPAIFCTNSVPVEYIRQPLTLEDLEEPLPDFFKHFCHQEFSFGIATLAAERVPTEVAEILNLDPDACVISMYEVFYNNHDRPILCAIDYFNQDAFRLNVARSFAS